MFWEYKVEPLHVGHHPYDKKGRPSEGVQDILQAIGADGWELVQVQDLHWEWRNDPCPVDRKNCPGKGLLMLMYFKRPKAFRVSQR